jgi:hypothetical protein
MPPRSRLQAKGGAQGWTRPCGCLLEVLTRNPSPTHIEPDQLTRRTRCAFICGGHQGIVGPNGRTTEQLYLIFVRESAAHCQWTRGKSTGDSSFGRALGYIWLCLAVACACWPDAGLLSAERACDACLIHNSLIVPVAILVCHA